MESSKSSGFVTVGSTKRDQDRQDEGWKKCWGYILKGVECLKAKCTYLKLVQKIVVEYSLFSPQRFSQWFSRLLLWISIEFNTFTRQFNSYELVRSQRQVSVLLDGIATWDQELPASCHVKHFLPCGVHGGALYMKSRVAIQGPLYLHLSTKHRAFMLNRI